jgi:hypothetical protein
MGCVEASQIQANTNMDVKHYSSARTHQLSLSAIKIVQHTKLKEINSIRRWNLRHLFSHPKYDLPLL